MPVIKPCLIILATRTCIIVEVIKGKQEHDQLESLLKENNVGLPPSPPERPKANLEDIPVGARLQDPEISASVSIDINAGLVACSQLMGQCIREDIAQMFARKKAGLSLLLFILIKQVCKYNEYPLIMLTS